MGGEPCSSYSRPLLLITNSLRDTKAHQPFSVSRGATAPSFGLLCNFLAVLTGCGARGIEGTRRSPTSAVLGERKHVGTCPPASPSLMCNFQAQNYCFACWAFYGGWAKLPARSQDLQPYESCRTQPAAGIFSWIEPRTILFSSEMFSGPTTCASIYETTKKAPSPSYLI